MLEIKANIMEIKANMMFHNGKHDGNNGKHDGNNSKHDGNNSKHDGNKVMHCITAQSSLPLVIPSITLICIQDFNSGISINCNAFNTLTLNQTSGLKVNEKKKNLNIKNSSQQTMKNLYQ